MDLCRFCSKTATSPTIKIFNDKKTNVIGKLEIFKNIKIEESDKLSKLMCSSCYRALDVAYNFHLNFQKSQAILILLELKTDSNQKKNLKILPNPNCITWECKKCKETFTSAEDFMNHTDKIHLVKELTKILCFLCDKSTKREYKTKRELEMHFKKFHINRNLCTFCNTWFLHNLDVDNHVKNEHPNYQYLCRICNRTLNRKSELIKHFKSDHPENKLKLYCSSCNKLEFENILSIALHIKEVHQETQEKTYHTVQLNSNKNFSNLLLDDNEIFMDEEFLEEWNEEFLDEIFFEKSGDTFKFTESWLDLDFINDNSKYNNQSTDNLNLVNSQNQSITNHEFTDTNQIQGADISSSGEELSNKTKTRMKSESIIAELYTCPKCNEKFDKLPKLKFHLAHIHDENCLICNFCNHKFNRYDLLNSHISKHILENITIYSKVKSQLEIIRDDKNDIRLLKCKQCLKEFHREKNFLTHICISSSTSTSKSKLKNDSKGNFLQCVLCKLNFKTHKDAYKHKKEKHDINPIECMICDKQFKTQIGLEYHLKVHAGIKAFNCPYCEKTFTANINLNAHLRNIHSEIKNFECKLCDRKFSTSDHFKKHVASIHQKKRNYMCTVCNKGFSQKSHLTQHRLIHTGEKRYFCEFCLKGYIKRSEMQKHVKKCNQLIK